MYIKKIQRKKIKKKLALRIIVNLKGDDLPAMKMSAIKSIWVGPTQDNLISQLPPISPLFRSIAALLRPMGWQVVVRDVKKQTIITCNERQINKSYTFVSNNVNS